MKRISRYLLIIGTVILWIVFSIDSACGAGTTYAQYEYDVVSAPIMSLTLRGLFDKEEPYLVSLIRGRQVDSKEEESAPAASDASEGATDSAEPAPPSEVAADTEDETASQDDQTVIDEPSLEDNSDQEEVNPPEDQAMDENGEGTLNQDGEGALNQDEEGTSLQESEDAQMPEGDQTEQEQHPEPIEKAEEEIYVCSEVSDDYFSDAVFIGDSRTVGLSEYCQPLMDRATFYAKVSLTIYDFGKKEFVSVPVKTEDPQESSADGDAQAPAEEVSDGGDIPETDTAPEQVVSEDAGAGTEMETVTIEEALSRQEFGKIYIMLGLNELGSGNTEYFTNSYSQVITRIRELQPDAQIYIQGIMHVTAKKSGSDKVFKNEVINERNAALSQLADGKSIFYIDMNEATDDEEGALTQELTFDDIHLKAKSYALWYDYLKSHAYLKVNSIGATE